MAEQPPPSHPRKPRRHWLRFSLRTMFVVVTLFCVWLGIQVQRANRQKRAVEGSCYGDVFYDYQVDSNGEPDRYAEPLAPKWLTELVGKDFFYTVVCVFVEGGMDDGKEVMQHVEQLSKLKVIYMDNGMTDDSLAHLENLTQLEVLICDNNEITDAGLAHLRRLTKLRVLDLMGTQITNAGLEHLKGMTQLKALSLENLTDAGLKHLQGMTQLQELGVDDRISDAAIEELRKSAPNVKRM